MAEAEDVKFKVTIDGIPVEVAPGTSILNAARKIGGDIVLRQCVTTPNWREVAVNAVPVWSKSPRDLKKIRGRCQNWWLLVVRR